MGTPNLTNQLEETRNSTKYYQISTIRIECNHSKIKNSSISTIRDFILKTAKSLYYKISISKFPHIRALGQLASSNTNKKLQPIQWIN